MTMQDDLTHRSSFEQHSETYVRLLAERGDNVGKEARAYLQEKQVEREQAAAELRDSREEETLRLAREANKLARASMYVAVLASLMSAIVGATVGFALGK